MMRRDRNAESDGLALATSRLIQYEGDSLRALVAIRSGWRSMPDPHEIEVVAIAFSWISERLTPAERVIWAQFHADADDVAYLARAIAGRHARHLLPAQSRKVAA